MEKEFNIEKRTYDFSLELLRFVKKVKKGVSNDILIKQLIRSGTSIGANIHEARGGHTKKDFINFHSIALKSANETSYWLSLIGETNLEIKEEADKLIDEVEQLAKIIASIKITAAK